MVNLFTFSYFTCIKFYFNNALQRHLSRIYRGILEEDLFMAAKRHTMVIFLEENEILILSWFSVKQKNL